MTDIRATRVGIEIPTSLTVSTDVNITRTAVEVVGELVNNSSVNTTRVALEVLGNMPFENVPHTEIWSGFPVEIKELTEAIDIPLLKEVAVTLSNGTKPYSNTLGWDVYNGGEILINGNGRLYPSTAGSWYLQRVSLTPNQRDYINNRNIKVQATFNMSSENSGDVAALYVSFLDYYGNWIGGKGIDFTAFPAIEPEGTDYSIEEWVPMGTYEISFEIIANMFSTTNDNYTGSVSAILTNQIDRKHIVLKANQSKDDSATDMILTDGSEMPFTATFGRFNYPGRYGGIESTTTGYYEIEAPEETLISIANGIARISLGTFQFNEAEDDQSRVFLEALNANDDILATLTTGSLSNYGQVGTVSSLENNSIPPTTTKFKLWMDYARIDGTVLDAVISNLIAIIDYNPNSVAIPPQYILPTGIPSAESFGNATIENESGNPLTPTTNLTPTTEMSDFS